MSYKIALRLHAIADDFLIFNLPRDAGLRVGLKRFIQDCGNPVICEFSKFRRRRSTGPLSQNHHLNGHIIQIMKFLGMTSKSEYDQVKTEIKRIAHVAFGYPERPGSNGRFFKSEADCNTEECNWLIEASHMLAAELGIILIETED